MRQFFAVLISILFFLSCNNDIIVRSEKKLPVGIWKYEDTLKARFDLMDNSIPYDICLDVYYTKDYPFQNIYFKITDDFTGESNTDTVTVNLFDKYGAALGKSKKGGYKKKIILRKGFIFKNGGNHNIEIMQFTRKDSLEGINELEFFIEKTKK